MLNQNIVISEEGKKAIAYFSSQPCDKWPKELVNYWLQFIGYLWSAEATKEIITRFVAEAESKGTFF